MKSIIQDEKKCFVCGSPYVECHHIFGSFNRKDSERYGLKVYLCHRHHNEPPEGVHFDRDFMDELHKIGQRAFEKDHSREEFKSIFLRNYLDED